MSEKRIDSRTVLGAQLARVAKEGGLILAIGGNLFLLLALLSYDPRDPGWSHLGYQGRIGNLAGVTGAWIADLVISLLGLAGHLLPLLVIWPAVRFLLRRRAGLLDAIPFVMLRTSGALLVLVALATLCSLHLSNERLDYPFTAGGLVGQALSDLSVAWLGIVGGSLVSWTLLMFGLTLYVDLSWRTALEGCGGGLLQLWHWISGLRVRPQVPRPVAEEAQPQRVEPGAHCAPVPGGCRSPDSGADSTAAHRGCGQERPA